MEVTSLLLDTHALLWVLVDPERIPAATLASVRAPETTLYVSAASAWEIATKYRLGELEGAAGVVSGYREHLARLRAEELAITGTTRSPPARCSGPSATRSTRWSSPRRCWSRSPSSRVMPRWWGSRRSGPCGDLTAQRVAQAAQVP